MLTEDDIEAVLTAALIPVATALGAGAIEREELHDLDCRCIHMRADSLQVAFYFAARLNEIQPGVTTFAPAGPERLSFDSVQQWLGEPVQPYMFNNRNLDAACQQVADFAERLILRFREDPAAAVREIHAIDDQRADAFHIREIRERAEAAWAERDLAEAKRLYAGIAKHLTAAESKRLAFARKKRS